MESQARIEETRRNECIDSRWEGSSAREPWRRAKKHVDEGGQTDDAVPCARSRSERKTHQ